MTLIAQLNSRSQDLMKLEARMHLMLAVVIIAMIGLVLIIFVRAWARGQRRQHARRRLAAQRDEWAVRPLVERFPARLPSEPPQPKDLTPPNSPDTGSPDTRSSPDEPPPAPDTDDPAAT